MQIETPNICNDYIMSNSISISKGWGWGVRRLCYYMILYIMHHDFSACMDRFSIIIINFELRNDILDILVAKRPHVICFTLKNDDTTL